jgi:hypothetical protein
MPLLAPEQNAIGNLVAPIKRGPVPFRGISRGGIAA